MALNDLLLKREEVVINIQPDNIFGIYGFVLPFPEILYEKLNPSTKGISYECARKALEQTSISIVEFVNYQIDEIKIIDNAIIQANNEWKNYLIDDFQVKVHEKLETKEKRYHLARFISSRIYYFLDKKAENKEDNFNNETNELRNKLINKLTPELIKSNIIIPSSNGIYTLDSGGNDAIHLSEEGMLGSFYNRINSNFSEEKFKKLFPNEKLKGYYPHNINSTILALMYKEWAIDYVNNLLQEFF